MVRALTARIVESLKPPIDGGRATFADGVVEGPELPVGARGLRTWSLHLRTMGGTRSRPSLGNGTPRMRFFGAVLVSTKSLKPLARRCRFATYQFCQGSPSPVLTWWLLDLQQQARFDDFPSEFNNERSHEALAMKPPSEVYRRSAKP